jgi:hypothetical protein
VPVKQGDYVFCTRDDKQNLVEKWKQGRKNYLFVNTTQDLMDADLTMVKHRTQLNTMLTLTGLMLSWLHSELVLAPTKGTIVPYSAINVDRYQAHYYGHKM